ncbi:MAG: DMT family transporter [Planctomycetota bacterium]
MSAMHWVLVACAVVTGMVIPLQPGINAELGRHAGSPYVAGFVSFLGGTLVLACAMVIVRQPDAVSVRSWVGAAPWWAYLGGVIGATFVTVSLVLAPRLGAATLVAGIVTGQLIGSIVIDHYGWVGFAKQPVTWPRALGVALLITGVLVMQLGRGEASSSKHRHNTVVVDD